MQQAGVLATEGDGLAWAWAGVAVDWASDLTADRSYADLDEQGRIRKALAEQQAWLAGLVGQQGAIVEDRWIWNSEDNRLRLRLLLRVERRSVEEAQVAALSMMDRLSAAPSHVGTSPLSDFDVAAALDPFDPDPLGSAEIRKRTATARPQRPDAGMPLYWMPQPFHVAPVDWGNLFHQITRLRQPLVLSVALEPAIADPRVMAELDRLGTVFSRLARDGEMLSTGIYSGSRKLSPDAFAVDAQKVFADLSRRYRNRVFRFRVAVASPEPLDDGFLHVIGATITPPDDAKGETFLTRELSGDNHQIVRPASLDEFTVFTDNLRGLGLRNWGQNRAPEPFSRIASVAGLVDVTEASAAFRLPIAANGVLAGFPVRRPTFAVRVEVNADGPMLEIGDQMVGGVAEGPVGIPLNDLTMHAFVVGTTGSGKTSTVLKVLDDLWRIHHVPFLVIEPVNSSGDDYRWFLEREGFEDSLVLTAGDDAVAPLRVNPFEVPSGVRVGEHVANLLACFDAAFGLWDPLPAIYRIALEQTYLEAGWALDDVSDGVTDWPTLEHFVEEMRHATEDLEYAGEVRSNIIAASRVRVEQLQKGPARSVFDCQRSTPLELVLGRPAVIELSRVGAGNDQELALVMAILLNSIAERRRSLSPSRNLAHVIVVEEAHKLLRNPQPGSGGGEAKGDAAGAAAKLFANLLAEIRKYGQGLLIADQDPAKLVPDAYKNTNLKIMHRLPHEDDRKLVGASMRFDEDHDREAAALLRFHAFVHAEGFDRPALVRVENIRSTDQRELPADSVLTERFARAGAELPALAASVPPYAECEGCSAPCKYRSRGSAASATRSASSSFAELMGGWKPEASEKQKDAWWTGLDAFLEGLAGQRGGSDQEAKTDLQACVLMHLLRGLYQTDRLPWMRRWRSRHSNVAPGSGVASGAVAPTTTSKRRSNKTQGE